MPDRAYDALHLGLAGAPWCAVVVEAKAHARPAEVFAFRDDIDFVTAHGPVLLLPQFSVGRIEGETLRVAQTVGPDFRQRSVRADEWIVGGRRAVGRDADNLANVVVEFLRKLFRSEVVAERDEQIAVRRLHHAATDIETARDGPFLSKDDFCLVESRRFIVDRSEERRVGNQASKRGTSEAN